MVHSSVADLTVEDFKGLIKEVVSQTIMEMLGDPYEGLEMHEEIKERLHQSLSAAHTGVNRVSAQDVAAKLGLEW
jgi:hypothetical protein